MQPRTVLEYALADKFALLFLTADGVNDSDDLEALISVNRDQFDPELVADMEGLDDLGIPDNITCSGVTFNITEDGVFHGSHTGNPKASFSAKTMEMTWLSPHSADPSRRVKHRDDGPASIKLSDYTTHHEQGLRTGFCMSSWAFVWYHNGAMERAGGPYSIHGEEVKALLNPRGELNYMRQLRYTLGWNHPNGHNINNPSVAKAETENSIQINRLDPSETVFANEMERVFFYAST